jgi:hypothetical protein
LATGFGPRGPKVQDGEPEKKRDRNASAEEFKPSRYSPPGRQGGGGDDGDQNGGTMAQREQGAGKPRNDRLRLDVAPSEPVDGGKVISIEPVAHPEPSRQAAER